MLSDLRYAWRRLVKAPGFTLVALLTLALGVGANAAIFSVINAVLLHPFPYVDADRLLFVGSHQQGQNGNMPVTYPDYLDWRKSARSFTGLAFASGRSYTLTRLPEPAVIRGAAVSASVWPLLGVAPALGRTFTTEEDRPDAPPVCVLSYGIWQARFGADPKILGRVLTLDGKPYTAIGVMPPSFKFWAGDVWLPVGLEANSDWLRSRVMRLDSWVVATPKPGVSRTQAEAELNVIAAQIARAHPETNKGIDVSAQLLSDAVTGQFREPLLLLLGAVACVLLIACANVANLLLARTAGRQREYAIRVALGATRRQLIRQMLLETGLLALLGGIAGVLLGAWGLQALLVILPANSVPAEAQIYVDVPVMLCSLAAVVGTMLIFGLFPACAGSRPPLGEALQEGSRGTAGARTGKFRAGLIIAEIGLSVTLLVGAGLLLRNLARLHVIDPGFNSHNLLVAPLQLPAARYPTGERATAFFAELLENVRRLPGVKVAAAATTVPFMGGNGMPLLTEGKVYRELNDLVGVQFVAVMGDVFAAQGLPLVRGRAFTPADRAGAAPVIILNEAAVKQFLPGGDPLGRRVMLGVPPNLIQPGMLPPGFDHFEWATVVGVVRSVRQFALDRDPPPAAYIPVDQCWNVASLRAAMTLLIRTEGDPRRAVAGLRTMLAAVDRDQPMGRVAPMDVIIAESLHASRFITILLGLFAALALTLAIVGIYGVVAWNVAQRTREFGIRQALGANATDVLQLVVRQGMRVVGLGVAVGLIGSLAVARTLQGMLYRASAFDPWTFAGVALLLAAIALLACLVPARRATKIDPMIALRAE